MKKREIILNWRHAMLWIAAALLYSCSTPKDIAYFQNAMQLQGMALQAEQKFRLRPEDKISIVVSSSNPMLEQQFTLTSRGNSNNILGPETLPATVSSGSGNSIIAYTVDEQGTIDFPVLGKIRVEGMTREEVAAYIKERLIARELVSEPIVTVEYVNMSVNVLGEVSSPGNVPITKDHFTVIDALAKSGDLTINGNRRAVMVSRNNNGVNEVHQIDLTDMQQTMLSDGYYLQQNDLVYVTPNDKRKRDSTNTGNIFYTPYIWMSIISMLASLIAIFK